MENREIGAILSTFEKFSTMNFSKVDKMAPISPFPHFPVANFSAQRSIADQFTPSRLQFSVFGDPILFFWV
jgi:hypothetical protein